MASQEAVEKLRAVLDYIPEEAALRLPGDPQQYYDALTRRLSRSVAVKTLVRRKVIVQRPESAQESEPDAPAWQPPLPAFPRSPGPLAEPELPAYASESTSVVEAQGPNGDAQAEAVGAPPEPEGPSEVGETEADDFFTVSKDASGKDLEPVGPEVSLSESEWRNLETSDIPEETAEAPIVAGDEPLPLPEPPQADEEAFEEVTLPSGEPAPLPEAQAELGVTPRTDLEVVPQEAAYVEPSPEAEIQEFEIEEEGEVSDPGDFEILAEDEETAQGEEPPYQINDFTLFRRESRGKSGARESYFFSAEPEVEGASRSSLPEGYEVIVNPTSGVPVVRKALARVMPVTEIEGLGPVMAERLERAGVRTSKDLLRIDTRQVASETGISERLLNNFRAMAELLQVPGITPAEVAAIVYAGTRSLPDFLGASPADLSRGMAQAAKDYQIKLRTKVTAQRVRTWQEKAKKLQE